MLCPIIIMPSIIAWAQSLYLKFQLDIFLCVSFTHHNSTIFNKSAMGFFNMPFKIFFFLSNITLTLETHQFEIIITFMGTNCTLYSFVFHYKIYSSANFVWQLIFTLWFTGHSSTDNAKNANPFNRRESFPVLFGLYDLVIKSTGYWLECTHQQSLGSVSEFQQFVQPQKHQIH